MARGLVCEVHVHDSVVPQEDHHVWPLGYHGPNIKANKIKICCNAHSDIHYFMDYLLKHNGIQPADWRTYGPRVRMFALIGYRQVMDYATRLSEERDWLGA